MRIVSDISFNGMTKVKIISILETFRNIKGFIMAGNHLKIAPIVEHLTSSVDYLYISENILDNLSVNTFAKCKSLDIL